MSAILDWLALGGPVMWILAVLSVLGLTLILAKLWEFTEQKVWSRDFVAPALQLWRGGQAEQALALLSAHPGPLAAVLAVAVRERQAGTALPDVSERLAALAGVHLDRARSLFRPLEVIATLAPLLGLLGTVLGMIEAFQRLQAAGERVDPALLSGGIWEALLTTAAGLIVAIPAVAALNGLERVVETLHRDLEAALSELLTHHPGAAVPAR
jgi:biopolymer transport protein ExbB